MSEQRGGQQNLKPFKKGHAPLRGCGRPKGSRSFAVIVRKMLGKNPEKLLALCEKDKQILRALKKHGIKVKDVKDLITLKVVSKAADGDLKAVDWIAKQIGEDVGETLNVREYSREEIESLTDEQLEAIVDGKLNMEQAIYERRMFVSVNEQQPT